MNILLLFACMIIISVVLGHGVLSVLYFKKSQKICMAEKLIAGWLVIIGLAEAAHLAAVFLGWPFSRAIRMFVAEAVGFCAISGGIWLWSARKSTGRIRRKKESFQLTTFRFGLILSFVLLAIWQIVTMMSGDAVYRTGDMMVETVETFLDTDRVYEINPLTGRAYESGIPLRIKILGLPTLYGAMCSLFGIAGVDLVWRYIPLMVLLLSYAAFWLIGKTLFDGEKESEKRLVFMVLVALIFCVGDYMYGMDGFGILHCGFQGSVIRNVVLVPYTFALTLRRKWRVTALVILAEACIAWTLYGMGVCLAIVLGMAVIYFLQHRKTSVFRNVGKGA